jgi:Na+/H+ antiporter NhaA
VETIRWITLIALTLLLAEGFTLSMFPAQFQRLLLELDPKMLQAAGLCETLIASGLIAALLLE